MKKWSKKFSQKKKKSFAKGKGLTMKSKNLAKKRLRFCQEIKI